MPRAQLASCLYQGRVRHRRHTPVAHRFEFPLFMLYLDLAELDRVFAGRWLWSTRRAAWARFDRRDHLGDPRLPLDLAVRDLVEARTGARPAGPVRLLTQLRYAGHVFNPLSVYYCLDAAGRAIEAVVADVSNTPWNERHAYVLGAAPARASLRASSAKQLHVSPFMGMEIDYRFHFSLPGRHLALRIENRARGGGRCFDASLALRRREIGGASLARALAAHPLMTAELSAAIYWQALRLFFKRVPFHAHPAARERGAREVTP